MNRMGAVTRALLIATVAMYGVQLLSGDASKYWLALWPLHHDNLYGGGYAGPEFQPWQLVTYGFLHNTQDFTHLFFNMFALWMFGSEIERLLGPKRFLLYYLVCIVGAGATQLLVEELSNGPVVPVVGASGGVFGLLLAYALAFPRRRLMLLFPPIPMPAWLFVTLYGALELYLGVTGTQQGVAHFAHLGGMAAGFVLILWWRRQSASL
jgi:membrane associated rhomboid family serine protease